MMKVSRALIVATAVVSALVESSDAQEVFCSSTAGQVTERWPNQPQGACTQSVRELKFEIHMSGSAYGYMFVPWLPLANCLGSVNPTTPPYSSLQELNALVQGGTSGFSAEQIPGVQSVIRAAQAWNDVPHSRLTFDLKPTFVDSGAGIVCTGIPPMQVCNWAFPTNPNLTSSPAPCQGTAVSSISAFPATADNTMSPPVLATTFVSIDLQTGEIVDADILLAGFNHSWYEKNEYQGNSYISSTSAENGEVSAVDLQGVLTHEFGHFAGLGHSLIDSLHLGTPCQPDAPCGPEAALSPNMPTMFPTAQLTSMGPVEVFPGPNPDSDYPPGGDPPDAQQSFCGLEPFNKYGEILGWEARTLEAEDRAMIGRVYPSSSFLQNLGAVQGQVRRDGNDSNPWSGSPLPGAHVVAVKEDDPNGTRIGVLSLSGGSYRLDGLPPGRYYIFVESIDSGPDGFFDPLGLPTWLSQANDCNGFPLVNGQAVPWDFPMDFWNGVDEKYDEAGKFHETTLVDVGAGANLVGADLRVQTATGTPGSRQDVLTVSRNGSIPSSRGVQAGFTGPNDISIPGGDITFQVTEPNHPDAGAVVTIALTWQRAHGTVNRQLFQCFNPAATVSSLGFAPFVGTLDSNGVATFSLSSLLDLQDTTVQEDLRYMNVFAQASVGEGANLQVSNPVSVWFAE